MPYTVRTVPHFDLEMKRLSKKYNMVSKVKINLRNVAMIIACLAGSGLVFSSCCKDDKADEKQTLPTLTAEQFIVINNVRWATSNVDAPGTFAAKAEDLGMFYQWNRKTAWPATGRVTGWDSSCSENRRWENSNNPCPEGWRLPTSTELQSLLMLDQVRHEWTTVNGVSGMKFTDLNSGNFIFLPAAGYRDKVFGSLSLEGEYGYYWSGEDMRFFKIEKDHSGVTSLGPEASGYSVRCVR